MKEKEPEKKIFVVNQEDCYDDWFIRNRMVQALVNGHTHVHFYKHGHHHETHKPDREIEINIFIELISTYDGNKGFQIC